MGDQRQGGKSLPSLQQPNGPEEQSFLELQKTIDKTDNLIPNSIQLDTTLQGWVSFFYFFTATFLIPASEGLPSLKE